MQWAYSWTGSRCSKRRGWRRSALNGTEVTDPEQSPVQGTMQGNQEGKNGHHSCSGKKCWPNKGRKEKEVFVKLFRTILTASMIRRGHVVLNVTEAICGSTA